MDRGKRCRLTDTGKPPRKRQKHYCPRCRHTVPHSTWHRSCQNELCKPALSDESQAEGHDLTEVDEDALRLSQDEEQFWSQPDDQILSQPDDQTWSQLPDAPTDAQFSPGPSTQPQPDPGDSRGSLNCGVCLRMARLLVHGLQLKPCHCHRPVPLAPKSDTQLFDCCSTRTEQPTIACKPTQW